MTTLIGVLCLGCFRKWALVGGQWTELNGVFPQAHFLFWLMAAQQVSSGALEGPSVPVFVCPRDGGPFDTD